MHAPSQLAVKLITDLDDLVDLMRRGLTVAKPWQRRLAVDLAELDRLMQVLRLTVSLERPDQEILAAATELSIACRRAVSSQSGTRADHTTRAALALVADLAHTAQIEITRNGRLEGRCLPEERERDRQHPKHETCGHPLARRDGSLRRQRGE